MTKRKSARMWAVYAGKTSKPWAVEHYKWQAVEQADRFGIDASTPGYRCVRVVVTEED